MIVLETGSILVNQFNITKDKEPNMGKTEETLTHPRTSKPHQKTDEAETQIINHNAMARDPCIS